MTPQRIQRKRTKGWRMPPDTLYVGRPTIWGNPFTSKTSAALAVRAYRMGLRGRFSDLEHMIGADPLSFISVIVYFQRIRRRIGELRGKNLACWCPVGKEPCHADLLLEAANK